MSDPIPVLMLHGWAANHHIFDLLAADLPECRIAAPDLPGHGAAQFDGSFNVAAAADALAAQLGEPAHLLGWSLGGLVALHLAAKYPQKVRSLCLTASFARLTAAPDYPEGLAKPALGKMIPLFAQDFAKYMGQFLQLQFLHIPERAHLANEALPDMIRHGVPPGLEAALEAAVHTDARALLPQVRCPVLLVFGGKDGITPPRMGEYLHRHLPGSRLLLIEKAAHIPFLSHEGEFAAAYRQFIGLPEKPAAI
ncbi:pimeloyl-ACP methyl ester esterase BioH [Eikenella sp. S3360]|uniref:Pimeloyl-ACP methyl ester esterase BioH n=1 Tax=Eikenella glucosivorans TaxID=2766967 RepID=A0ABS0NAT8_9NEIS|nr:pimeloyl-ACP methyl ester esterase BioH [Eikenella glucosivorans]MBH5329436.1 pimeloyl-ACP methyl ester esterase BioH [Eikenella glucosivorans]